MIQVDYVLSDQEARRAHWLLGNGGFVVRQEHCQGSVEDILARIAGTDKRRRRIAMELLELAVDEAA